jgi:osmotically-inducible protein OsmY
MLVVLAGCTAAIIGGSSAVVGTMLLRDKTTGDSISDIVLTKRVSIAIYKVNPDVHARVGINVQEGDVLLTGSVTEESQRLAVETAVWSVKSVKRVYNNIEISDIAPIKNYPKDAWITSVVKAKLLAVPRIRSVNYSVKTVNNVVYIFGIARTKGELDKVVDIASKVNGVDRVMSYIRLRV